MKQMFSIKALLYVSLPLIITLSCNKEWLEKKHDSTLAIPNTLKHFQEMMDSYFTMNSDKIALGEIAADGHHIANTAWSTSSSKVRNAYTWSHEFPYFNIVDWRSTYSKILATNVVLEGLQKLQPSPAELNWWNFIKGQALFHRSDAFWRAAQVWAPAYQQSNYELLGIPLKLESDVTLVSKRSRVRETYDRIISDLLLSAILCPDLPAIKTRPSKTAAFALLARVYLSMGEYGEAKKYADSCLTLYDTLIDYNLLDTASNYIGDFRTNPEVIIHMHMYTDGNNGFLTDNCLIDSSLYALYAPDDLRKKLYFKYALSELITFKGNYYNNKDLFVGIATDEVYLISAECYARIGDKEKAMSILNKLLEKRWEQGMFIPYVAQDANDALRQILLERKKELVLRGLRWSDLRRLNREEQFQTVIIREIGGRNHILEPNSYRYIFPIPDDIISISGMQQNTGW